VIAHRCARPGCPATVPARMLACRAHWFELPRELRDAIWAAYRPGQSRKDPKGAYLAVVRRCVDFWEAKP
jgi:hypothetical protein